ncbi:adenosylcobinamide-GDP ribazoletransferase [Psychromonas sp. psych-6C06]|uniref:adenosylcobinamide-GDP ribazoletransferase n=1 Tax=Psychromonas sp. psych-6C06 TaxID=2058089 RepID=UPI00187CDDE5|nr:adenosylcobinamide-GDP ribazoletransferase [Psychromonas sp. psych-6C06]
MKYVIQKIQDQCTLFLYALSYFTRVPTPASLEFDKQQFHKANAYLPIIGLLISIVMAIVFYLCQLLFSEPISVLMMMSAALLITGALHEDGFADCCDGFGGGYNATQRLKIMKDSAIGSYAGIGLVVLFLFKFILLGDIAGVSSYHLFMSLLISSTLSRYSALCIMQYSDYVRLQETGKVQSLANKLTTHYFMFASICALLPLFLISLYVAVLVLFVALIITLLLRALFIKNLKGYTGDCLGFTQQLAEISILLLLSTVFIS